MNGAGLDDSTDYTGHNYDPTLDKYFAQARFYDATNKRFVSQDPIKDALNWYSYAYNNSINFIDPTGLLIGMDMANGINSKIDLQISQFAAIKSFLLSLKSLQQTVAANPSFKSTNESLHNQANSIRDSIKLAISALSVPTPSTFKPGNRVGTLDPIYDMFLQLKGNVAEIVSDLAYNIGNSISITLQAIANAETAISLYNNMKTHESIMGGAIAAYEVANIVDVGFTVANWICNSAKVIKSGKTIAEVIGKIPQGLTKEAHEAASKLIKNILGELGDDVVVQGSRAGGTANVASDIDYAVRVSSSKFDDLIRKSFGTPNIGSAKERTMLHAIETGKIQSGEAGLRSLRIQLQEILGIDVDISIIKIGGAFDNGPIIPLP